MVGHFDTFVREGREEIRQLNDSLLALEADPKDTATMDDIFRSAHTLKGNFSAMGFAEASNLAHAVEDMLDAMREGHISVTSDRMDLIFEGVDQLEAIVDEIEQTEDHSQNTDPTVERIRDALEEALEAEAEETLDAGGEPDASTADSGDPVALDSTATGSVLSAIEESVDPDEQTLVHARVGIGDSDMPGADGLIVLQRAGEQLPVVATHPSEGAIEDGEYDGTFDLLVEGAPERVGDALEGVRKVEDLALRAVTGAEPEGGESDHDGAEEGSTDGDDQAESAPAGGPSGPQGDEIKSIKVDVDRLDELYGSVQQLVTSRVKLRRVIADLGGDPDDHLDELDKATDSLQDTVMDMRLVPMETVVGRFPRVVRDLARKQDKEVDFHMEGTDVELDRTILDRLSDPLIHILRNAVDHGIETPEEREANGKSPEGTVELVARREGDRVVLTVRDDGAGLDAEAIREKAREQGIRSREELQSMADDDVYDLVFHPGFSTAEEVTDVSGRGVGMDVVHETVSRLDGSVDVDSTPGQGTTVTLELPVSIAIVKVLFVEVGHQEYGIPLKKVEKISRYEGVETVNGNEVVKHDGELYPVVHLSEELDASPDPLDATPEVAGDGGAPEELEDAKSGFSGAGAASDGMLVRIDPEERAVAFRCDTVLDHEEVVIKPLEGPLSGTPGISGTAVLGDGHVVPIIDAAMI